MTVQANDAFSHRGRNHDVAQSSSRHIFDPSLFGLKPLGGALSCLHRGYVATFAVADSVLVLESLNVSLLNSDYLGQVAPCINSVRPECLSSPSDYPDLHPDDAVRRPSDYCYRNVNQPLAYTGGILIGEGRCSDYSSVGWHDVLDYQTLIELIFDAGVLAREVDRTEQASAKRKAINAARKRGVNPQQLMEEHVEFLWNDFDCGYKWSWLPG